MLFAGTVTVRAQAPSGAPADKTPEQAAKSHKASEKASFPFQIQLLETHIRFEGNGDSRKEVHTVVKLNDAMGVREFARLAFDYNRSFQQVEIPMVRVTHANGGTSDVLPSAISDAPNPAVEKYPAYHDVRVKSVRILGLQEDDLIEYRVISTTTNHPLAPDFWLEHTFDRSGQVTEESYELDLPGHLHSTADMRRTSNVARPAVYLGVPSTSFRNSGAGKTERSIFEWKMTADRRLSASTLEDGAALPDVVVSNFMDWQSFSGRLASLEPAWSEADRKEVLTRLESSGQDGSPSGKSIESLYRLVSQEVTTVDLPMGSTGYRGRTAKEVLETNYATPLEKCYLLARLAQWSGLRGEVLFYGPGKLQGQLSRPSLFDHVLVGVTEGEQTIALDPSIEVAPFGLIAAQFRGKDVLTLSPQDHADFDAWTMVPVNLPFPAFQKVGVNATLGGDGKLTAKVKYSLRGDNELLLRVALHKTPKEKWKDVAGLLALSDGFRGVVTNVNASDPMATQEPLIVEYELTQEKFVDWTKKPVRIPALLPQIGLPEAASRTSAGKIELGTPLDVETQLTLHLPAGTTVQAPAGTAVERDYAAYSSKYGLTGAILSATRQIRFLQREVAGDRTVDYRAFERAVLNDQAQYFVLDRGAGVKAAAQ